MMIKKRFIIPLLALTLNGCYSDLYDRVNELNERADAIENQILEFNTNLQSLSTVISALQKKDFITGLSQIKADGEAIGYTVNFVNAGAISIYNGEDATAPLIGTKMDSDGNYYWTVQYGKDAATWVTDADGNKILAVGIVPQMRIRDNRWQVSYDKGASWSDVGPCDGNRGDALFKSVETTIDYVIFHMSDGTDFKFPTYSAYNAIQASINEVASNTDALMKLYESASAGWIYLTSIRDVTNGEKVVGKWLIFSDNSVYKLSSYTSSNAPVILPRTELTDGKRYWAIRYVEKVEYQWILDADGNRIPCDEEKALVPVAGLTRDDDGSMWWNITVDGKTEYILDTDGNRVPASSNESYQTVFKSFDESNSEYVVVTLADGQQIKVPKMYTIAFDADTIQIKAGETKQVAYRIYGMETSTKIELFVQGEISVDAVPDAQLAGYGHLRIVADEAFSGAGKVLMIARLGGSSTKMASKVLNVELEPEPVDPENPDPENPDPENPDPENPDPVDPETTE